MMHRYDVAILRGAAVPTLVTGLVLVAVSAALAGPKGAIGAGLGIAVVALFFTVGLVAIAWASKISPFAMMQAAIFSYLVKIVLLGVLISFISDTHAFSVRAFAVAVLLSTFVWIGSQIRTFSKLKMLYVEPEPRTSSSSVDGRAETSLPE